MKKALNSSFNKLSGGSGLGTSMRLEEPGQRRSQENSESRVKQKKPSVAVPARDHDPAADTSFQIIQNLGDSQPKKKSSLITQYENAASNVRPKKENTTSSSYRTTPKSRSIVDSGREQPVDLKALGYSLDIVTNRGSASKQHVIFERLARRMNKRVTSRDIPGNIRRRALDISKGDIQLHNQSYVEPPPQHQAVSSDWSFDIFAENGGNDRLQKIYDIYQNVLSRPNDQLSGTKPQTAADENMCSAPRPPAKPRTNAHIYDNVHRFNPNARSANKSASPYATKLGSSHIRPSTRSQVRKKGPTDKESSSRISERHDSAHLVGKNGSAVGPITIIQAPLINTFNNYNSFNIGNISLEDVSVAHPTSASRPPAKSHFRLRKYGNAAGTKNKPACQHNLSMAK